MEENQLLKAMANTLTEAPIYEMDVTIRCPLKPEPIKRSWIDVLLRKPSPVVPEPETVRKLVFYESYVDNQYKIAGEASLLPDEIFQDQTLNISLITEHLPRIIYIIAAALQNDGREPESKLKTFLESNLKGSQLRDALVASFQTLNMEAFTDSIVLMKGTVHILKPQETSPNDGSELIASHTDQS